MSIISFRPSSVAVSIRHHIKTSNDDQFFLGSRNPLAMFYSPKYLLLDELEPSGTTITIIVSNPKVSGNFYAVNNRDLFISTDSGDLWKKLDTPRPGEYLPQIPWALAINDK